MKMNKDFDISQREGIETVDEGTYALGLLDIVEFLYIDLQGLMKREDRCFGIVKSYFNSISDAYGKIHEGENDLVLIDKFGKILYLFKPILKREFKRLVERGLSPADSNICIMRKLLGIIEECQELSCKKEAKTIKKIIDKLWDNIRNYAKKDSLYNLANTIKTYILKGTIGKHCLDKFTIETENRPKEKLTGENDRLVVEGDGGKKIYEVNL